MGKSAIYFEEGKVKRRICASRNGAEDMVLLSMEAASYDR